MDKDGIQHLFEQILSESNGHDDSAQKFFSFLIKTTLNYRDEMLASKGIVVTVDHVKTSLKWLVPALATGNIPELDNQVSLDLLRTWINALRTSPKKVP